VTQPKEEKAQEYLQGRGTAEKEKQPVNKKADYQDVYDILPFKGEKEIHESYFLHIC
jgi:hypothetical protein